MKAVSEEEEIRLNCLTGGANLEPSGKRKRLLNVSISRWSLMPLVK